MVILIFDVDWFFDKSEMPKAECMKLSSFFKQKGHQVYLVGDMSELTMQYDKLFVFCDSDSTPTLGSKILNDERTILMGKYFEGQSRELGPVVMGCRPDYLLYDITDEKSSSYTKANFITFFTNSGAKISTRQPWKNTKKGVKRTIITDTCLWKQSPAEIVECLKELINEPNIAFIEPISLQVLATNDEVQAHFVKLHFSRGTKFKWRNDLPQNEESSQLICDFLNELKKHTKSSIGAVPLRPCLSGIWEEDLERLMRQIVVFKRNKLRCFLPPDKTEKHQVYKWIRNWLEKGYKSSFIEEMVFFSSARKGLKWFEIINNPQLWTDSRVRLLIQLLNTDSWKNNIQLLCTQWGGDFLYPERIDWNIIAEKSHFIL